MAIVDDHRIVLDGLEARLSREVSEISVVATASRWSDLLSHPEFPVDVVVLDMRLEDGIPIATKIRALTAAGVATVVMSRHSDTISVNAAMQAGALGFVPKTESADELLRAIRAAAARERHIAVPLSEAIESFATRADPGLGKQEQRALVFYAAGRSIREVANEMGTTEETVKSYIKRARRKYRDVGVDLSTRFLLRKHSLEEGWITIE